MSKLIVERRSFLKGIAALITAPAIVRADALMSILPLDAPSIWTPSQAYSIGQVLAFNGGEWICIEPGVSSLSPATFEAAMGLTVFDGTATWSAV